MVLKKYPFRDGNQETLYVRMRCKTRRNFSLKVTRLEVAFEIFGPNGRKATAKITQSVANFFLEVAKALDKVKKHYNKDKWHVFPLACGDMSEGMIVFELGHVEGLEERGMPETTLLITPKGGINNHWRKRDDDLW